MPVMSGLRQRICCCISFGVGLGKSRFFELLASQPRLRIPQNDKNEKETGVGVQPVVTPCLTSAMIRRPRAAFSSVWCRWGVRRCDLLVRPGVNRSAW